VEIGLGSKIWVGLGGLALRGHHWISWGGFMEIYLHGLAGF
jgi:hypothetical protein